MRLFNVGIAVLMSTFILSLFYIENVCSEGGENSIARSGSQECMKFSMLLNNASNYLYFISLINLGIRLGEGMLYFVVNDVA